MQNYADWTEGPIFNVLAPEISPFRTRSPAGNFSALALGSFLFLHIGPWFLQKTPGNLVFLAEKPLDLFLGLVFAF